MPGIGRRTAEAVVAALAGGRPVRRSTPRPARSWTTPSTRSSTDGTVTSTDRPVDRRRRRRRGRPARPGDRHRPVRRRPQHRGQVPGGPRLVRRRQPAAGADRHHGRPRRAGPRGEVTRIAVVHGRAQPGVHRRPRAAHQGPRRAAATAAGAVPRGRPTTCWSAGSRASAAPHPLQGDGRLVDGIAAERELLRDAARRGRPRRRHLRPDRARAAAPRSSARSAARPSPALRVTVVSFGYKYGLPMDADLVVDCRFLPNPYWVPELRDADRPRRARCATTCWPRRAPRSSSTATRELLRLDRRRLPARGQALPDGRRRLHRRQAPQRGDRRGARRAGWRTHGVDAAVVHRDLGRE